jgi:hypothetical protein
MEASGRSARCNANYRFSRLCNVSDRVESELILFVRSNWHHEATTRGRETQNPYQPTSLNDLRKKTLQASAPASTAPPPFILRSTQRGPPAVPAANLHVTVQTRSSTYEKRPAPHDTNSASSPFVVDGDFSGTRRLPNPELTQGGTSSEAVYPRILKKKAWCAPPKNWSTTPNCCDCLDVGNA